MLMCICVCFPLTSYSTRHITDGAGLPAITQPPVYLILQELQLMHSEREP